MKKAILVLIAIGLSACATSTKMMNRVSLGMTKSQVIDILGDPDSTSAQKGCEYLSYTLYENGKIGLPRIYYVRMVGGKVESYGEKGDFDSTNSPRATLNVNVKKSN